VCPSAGQKGGKGRVLNRECREDEGEQIQGQASAGKAMASVF